MSSGDETGVGLGPIGGGIVAGNDYGVPDWWEHALRRAVDAWNA